MNLLHFANTFFTFNKTQWENFVSPNETNLNALECLFQNSRFNRRILKFDFPTSLNVAEGIYHQNMKQHQALGIHEIDLYSPYYPEALQRYMQPSSLPMVLYVRGKLPKDEANLIAMVGTRNPSKSGESWAKDFSAYFTNFGIQVVSGLAMGIDKICHQENLSNGTIAILGSEIGELYPKENSAIADKILENSGCLISSHPLGETIQAYFFPKRNEMIAAMAAGTIVIEGNEKSGAAITGKYALAMGKDVVVLAQNFRSEYGKGAIDLYLAGATFVKDEEAALQTLFSRLGGKQLNLPTIKSKKFSFEQFTEATEKDISASMALLQEAIICGSIEKAGKNLYKLSHRN